ncbi:MAG: hypothetical protein Q4C52_12095 [Eubacteriales bacterium]|nr:hypothetical protein [Eubacteriales bacterium]
MKNYRTIAIVFYLCAVAFYILASINIFEEATRDMGITWMCVGSMWLCLGSVYLNKSQTKDDDSDKDDK